ncbi:GNAT family N-acetyltransferase [Aeoliella sp. ICT_H6.2]|uniref:GNAT family N-acetyltransferase n=1 Tax=Aeoliella straminimaris TaxID=2954799 RepID=A0A9X2JKE7_9BACT|nr:GNAT family N-acetyltransferase [Aeoliella straminimaris]MCO6046334.1 GNAT family N-acetyltransferase [Aeoliella straminimaris]
MFAIQRFEPADWPATWQVLEPVFRAGETYPYAMDISQEESRKAWIDHPTATYVATDSEGTIVGTYYIRPNQPPLGAHVANCGYVVAESARGQGIATAMCQHSQVEARGLGFKAMQYNLVVTTNEVAVRLYQKQGFTVVGRLPQAFHHPQQGYVDALLMYKLLT